MSAKQSKELIVNTLFQSPESLGSKVNLEEFYEQLCYAIIELFSTSNGTIVGFPYSVVTEYVYSNEEHESEYNEVALHNLDELKNYCTNKNDEKIIELFKEKFISNYNLSKMQKEFMMKVAEEAVITSKEAKEISKKAKESSNKAKGISNEAEIKIKDVTKQIKEIEQIKGTIYTEFIAILSIFSALIFGLFGGFQGLSEAIVKLSKTWSVGRVLIISSGIMMCLTLLIFGLLQWVAKITGRKLTSCYCYEKNELCEHTLFNRYKTLFSLVFSFIFTFILGEYIEIFGNYSNISKIYIYKINLFTILAWIIPIFLLFIISFVLFKIFKNPYPSKALFKKKYSFIKGSLTKIDDLRE